MFALGGFGASFVAVVVMFVTRAVSEKGDCAPGSREARAKGCVCPRGKNWFGYREGAVGTSYLARGCPVIDHHPKLREEKMKD